VTSLWGYRRFSSALLLLTIIGLWLPSTPLVASLLTASLERQYPPSAIGALPTADIAIILGGFAAPARPPRVTVEYSEAVDRATHGAALYREGRVGHLLVSGGNVPWQPPGPPEAVLVADFLVDLGVPRIAITLEDQSRNTRENAVNSAAVIAERGWRSALLVRSATHMPRALGAFRKAGVAATPASTDVRGDAAAALTGFALLPDAAALASSTVAIREWIGLVVYRMRGWA
jgi:uncharacterized SAM-binding protein YcdF (DUF218 family)